MMPCLAPKLFAFEVAVAVMLNRVAPENSRQAAAKNFGFAIAFDMIVSFYNLLLATDGASSSHGLGGSVGPTSSTGAESEDGAFRSPRPSCDVDPFMVALKRVATANKIAEAAKIFVFARALDIEYPPE
jgi:hypothetical protein